jgi:hypothetical protein
MTMRFSHYWDENYNPGLQSRSCSSCQSHRRRAERRRNGELNHSRAEGETAFQGEKMAEDLSDCKGRQ